MQIKNLQKAALRIRRAIKKKERIILFGDSDLDGVSAVIILSEAIRSLGGTISLFYFPNREDQGYGLSVSALKELKSFAPALLILQDLGISNFKEAELAKKAKFDVIIADHHEALGGKVPNAGIVVDPKQPGDKYPFKELAACGVALKLAEVLLKKNISSSVRKNLVELAALGTIADMMPRKEDNELIIAEGLSSLEDSWRPGIKAFYESGILEEREERDKKIGYMISILNVRDVKDGLPGAFRLLTAQYPEEAKKLVLELEEKQRVRQERIQHIVRKVRDRLLIKGANSAIIEGDESFDFEFLGAVASIISREYKLPVFLYKDKGEEILGSVRAPEGFDTVKAMEKFAKLLMTFGGHAQASGFRLKAKNLAKFKQGLAEYFAIPITKKP
ncbi:MAG: hypothetical protein HYV78_01880 [Candidatus Wildermuthbacteria bacterium]|nr:hypothetical protein [Candidatus Wildermuthbacteria bacterium]